MIVTGGGTAGHVTPLLAVVSELVRQVPDIKISYVGTKKDVNSKLVLNCKYFGQKKSILAGKFRRYNGKSFFWYLKHPSVMLLNIRDLFYVGFGFLQSLFMMLFDRPTVVFVTGGYVGLPVGLAAVVLSVPIVTNDLDIFPGLTNRVLARFAKGLALAAPLSYYPQYANKPAVYCGVPVRQEFLQSISKNIAKQKLNIAPDINLVVVTGGSSGAGRLNSIVYNQLANITKNNTMIYWLCGSKEYSKYKQKINNNRVIIKDFETDMVGVLSAADLVISRAGATTLAEIASLAKPLIIIPSKVLTGGHQQKNAQVYADNNAAIVLNEDKLDKSPQELTNLIKQILESDVKRKDLENNISKTVNLDASLNISSLIIKVAGGVFVK